MKTIIYSEVKLRTFFLKREYLRLNDCLEEDKQYLHYVILDISIRKKDSLSLPSEKV